ncbi:MAG TPA: protein kinase, partial [Minicystis sp.]|nr:protein kinase [Minicystis sp.]
MPFAPPEGTALVEHLGSGTVFDVAVVRDAGARLVCKRLTRRARDEAAGRAAMVREARLLAVARHPALPTLVRVGADAHGPFV